MMSRSRADQLSALHFHFSMLGTYLFRQRDLAFDADIYEFVRLRCKEINQFLSEETLKIRDEEGLK